MHDFSDEREHHAGTDEHKEEAYDGDESDGRAAHHRVASLVAVARDDARVEAGLAAIDDEQEAYVAEGEHGERNEDAQDTPRDRVGQIPRNRAVYRKADRSPVRKRHSNDLFLKEQRDVED